MQPNYDTPIFTMQESTYFQAFLFQNYSQNFSKSLINSQKKQQIDHLIFFNTLFSPKQTAQSLKKRNNNLYMINFDNSDHEPDQIYNKRKKKVQQLYNKEKCQLEQLQQLKFTDNFKYTSIVSLMKFLYEVKLMVNKVKTDYYSTKTFQALKNSKVQDLTSILRVIRSMFQNIKEIPTQIFIQEQPYNNKNMQNRILQFLIIPRFLISKQKINRLVNDQKIQQDFIFLIRNQCLGHYNNEANKKMPQKNQMEYIRQLLRKNKGRQKFKKICSINHGSKFIKSQGNICYYQLYSKSLDYLKYLDGQLKRGKKYKNMQQALNKFPIVQFETQNDTISQTSSSNTLSFRKLGDVFSTMKIQSEFDQNQLKDQISIQMNKQRKSSMSPNVKSQQPKKKGFRVKKSMTAEIKTNNIILIEPPNQLANQI